MEVTDISGKEYELRIQKQKEGVWEIGVGSLAKGVYVVQVITDKGIYVEKFVKW